MKNDIIKFLLGEDSFDGVWYGEKHPTKQGAFWWRKYLRQFISESQSLHIHDVEGQSEQLRDFGKSLKYKGERILTDEGVEQAIKDFKSLVITYLSVPPKGNIFSKII